MGKTAIERQAELPTSIRLFKYNPTRADFFFDSWNPSKVRTENDLPPYLIMGPLDDRNFQVTKEGWTAIWQGTEKETYFKIKYIAEQSRYEISQNWCGFNGGISYYPARIPLGKLIAETLYINFPWDAEAKRTLEQKYQITYLEHSKDIPIFCGIPDGTFRTIAFPISIKNLRPFQTLLNTMTRKSPINYPINIEAKLLFQAINYLEGKAPEWTADKIAVFCNSINQTGTVPFGFPQREMAADGSAAWTLRRVAYILFISVPFAALTDFLDKMVAAINKGPIRLRQTDPIPIDLQPISVPPMFEYQVQNISLWDKEETTRCFWMFFNPDEAPQIPSVEELIHGEEVADALLQKAELINTETMEAIETINNKCR